MAVGRSVISLGVTGSFADADGGFMPDVPEWLFHDSAAALVIDGEVVAAVEQERLSRAKHTNRFPAAAIQACLSTAGVSPSQVDDVAFFFGEDYADLEHQHEYLKHPDVPVRRARYLLSERLREALGPGFAPEGRTEFVRHHDAHGFGAFADSGYDSALVVVIDGNGEGEGASIFLGTGVDLELLATHPTASSLGHLYLAALPLLGFRRFDEYKVMGLAPYGDPAQYSGVFERFSSLTASGGYSLDIPGAVERLLLDGYAPRRSGEPVRQRDCNLAAALQATLEKVQLHVVKHWVAQTGQRNLCMAGGVLQNSSANGALLTAGVVDRLFVHPASHDAGASAGAAQALQARSGVRRGGRPIRSVFLGPDLGTAGEVDRAVRRWAGLLEFSPVQEGEEAASAARLIADGQVIGWAVGRSEFGPRALGHRSILADPRRADNRERVNALVKKRESFRPFAPAVLQESAAEIFELGGTVAALDFMTYVVQVREPWREKLPATTHVDGSARLQTVSATDNPQLARVLQAFAEITGIPVLLNTSFNNFAEPIVQSVDDVLRCLATTGLDCVVLPGHLARRRPGGAVILLDMPLRIAEQAVVRTTSRPGQQPVTTVAWRRAGGRASPPLSEDVAHLLARAGSTFVATEVLAARATDQVAAELMGLWELRVLEVVLD